MKQVFLVVGSNTDVGKTIFCSFLMRRLAARSMRVAYLKPVQTGYPVDDDARTVRSISGNPKAESFFRFSEPISPHRCFESFKVTDEIVLDSTRHWIEKNSCDAGQTLLLVEGAGGVLSPMPSGNTLLDAWRPMRLPLILVCDPNLGGISQTLAAIESAVVRGYEIAELVFFQGNHENSVYVKQAVKKIVPYPQVPAVVDLNFKLGGDRNLSQFEDDRALMSDLDACIGALESFAETAVERRRSILSLARESVWWPFTQHQKHKSVTLIDSAYESLYEVYSDQTTDLSSRPTSAFDASASWWTLGVGHGNTEVALAVSHALGRYGHVLFPGYIHEPAALLAEKLLNGVGKGWAKRVFFTDNGSTAVEVALKMAFRLAAKRGVLNEVSEQSTDGGLFPIVFGLSHSYHGDTLGAMSATSPSVFNAREFWYQPRGKWLEFPQLAFKDGVWKCRIQREDFPLVEDLLFEGQHENLNEIFDIGTRCKTESQLVSKYRQQIHHSLDFVKGQVGALVIEPVIHGSAGMKFVDPLFQHLLVKECQANGIPVVLDEVFSGFWRLGVQAAAELLQIHPDVSCFSKALTGGMLPLAVTLTTGEVFDSFCSEAKSDALLHGHSYTAHPAGCAAALASIEIYGSEKNKASLDFWPIEKVREISSLKQVESVVALGTIISVTLKEERPGYVANTAAKISTALKDRGIEIRPLGNVVYLMVHALVEVKQCDLWLGQLIEVLKISD